MHLNRAGENGPVPGRHGRFFQQTARWYFSTREGANIGPFENRFEAEQGLKDFLDFITLADPKTLSSFYASLSTMATAGSA
jgi:Domain of unknown function (DUF6316)